MIVIRLILLALISQCVLGATPQNDLNGWPNFRNWTLPNYDTLLTNLSKFVGHLKEKFVCVGEAVGLMSAKQQGDLQYDKSPKDSVSSGGTTEIGSRVFNWFKEYFSGWFSAKDSVLEVNENEAPPTGLRRLGIFLKSIFVSARSSLFRPFFTPLP